MPPAIAPFLRTDSRVRTRFGQRLFTAAVLGCLLMGIAVADDHSATPSLVLTARSASDLIDNVERLLTTAGAPERAAQLQAVLQALNGLNGIDQGRPLGVLAYLSPVEGHDPELMLFIPIRSMDDLQQSVARVPQIVLAPRADDGWWELRAGPKTIPIRLENKYAFVAQREELLADPLPPIAHLLAAHADFDVALTLQSEGVPPALIARAVADLSTQMDRDRQRRPGESDEDYALRSQLHSEAGWLVEHTLQDVETARVGIRLAEDSNDVTFDARVATRPDSELSRALQQVPADASPFQSMLNVDAPLAAVASWKLTGGVHQFAQDALARIRRDVEQKMEQDGTANGPAAPPIRRILDAFAATVADGRMNGCLRFDGERPGAMLLISATRLADDPGVADAFETLLPLIAETPAVADLEMNAIEVDGIHLHRLTLQDVRKQDEWLYGSDVGLYLGAGRGTLWLAAGGFEREDQIRQLLSAPMGKTNAAVPPLLQVDLRLGPWLVAEPADMTKGPRWLNLAREAFADGGDQLHLELTEQRGELRLQGTLEEGYIRLLGAAWRAKHNRSSPPPSRNLAAPVQP